MDHPGINSIRRVHFLFKSICHIDTNYFKKRMFPERIKIAKVKSRFLSQEINIHLQKNSDKLSSVNTTHSSVRRSQPRPKVGRWLMYFMYLGYLIRVVIL